MLGEILVDSADQFEYVSSNFENLFQEGKDDNGVEKVLNFESRKKKTVLTTRCVALGKSLNFSESYFFLKTYLF